MAITIRFVGICTHITARNDNTHRVVLVRADHGAHLKEDAAIPPHIPKLIIDPADVLGIDGYPHGLEPMGPAGQWRIQGVLFKVDGATGDSIVRHDSFKDNVPRLKSHSRPGPSSEVIDGEQAACYFDLEKGVIHATQAPTQAWEAHAAVETNDEPALRLTCFWNRAVSRIRLRPGATVVLEHTGYAHGESDHDYLLHYRVLEHVPGDAEVPPERKRTVLGTPGDISIACSNSQYP
jgi:hypothetical protein